jgi:hypothetical protein
MITAREFLTDEVWKDWKRDYDELLSFRKSLKGPPDELQRMLLEINKPWIEFYATVLFHGDKSPCVCRRCSIKKSLSFASSREK